MPQATVVEDLEPQVTVADLRGMSFIVVSTSVKNHKVVKTIRYQLGEEDCSKAQDTSNGKPDGVHGHSWKCSTLSSIRHHCLSSTWFTTGWGCPEQSYVDFVVKMSVV